MVALICGAVCTAAAQLHMLNSAMRYFDQLEVQPIYQTAIMFTWILSGMVICNEAKFYTTLQMCLIFASVLVCCIGIYFLYTKRKLVKRDDELLVTANTAAGDEFALNERCDDFKKI